MTSKDAIKLPNDADARLWVVEIAVTLPPSLLDKVTATLAEQALSPNAMTFDIVIPARYASTRLPGKALLPIADKPMVAWVWERAMQAGARHVVIATDDSRIADEMTARGLRLP